MHNHDTGSRGLDYSSSAEETGCRIAEVRVDMQMYMSFIGLLATLVEVPQADSFLIRKGIGDDRVSMGAERFC